MELKDLIAQIEEIVAYEYEARNAAFFEQVAHFEAWTQENEVDSTPEDPNPYADKIEWSKAECERLRIPFVEIANFFAAIQKLKDHQPEELLRRLM